MITKELAVNLRKHLKASFNSSWKFSVRSDYNSIRVVILSGDIALPKRTSVNQYHYKNQFKDEPEQLAALEKIIPFVMRGQYNRNAGDLSADYCDYNYYVTINIGEYDQPYKLIA